MRKHLSLIGVLLVLVVFHLGPNAEAQIDDGYFYVSPAVLMGMNFDFSGDSGLEFYPSLSVQVTGGIAMHDFSLVVGSTMLVGGATLGYQFSFGHPNNLYIDLQGGMGGLAGAGVGWAWQPSTKVSSFRGKLFLPSPLGLGIEYDSRERLKPYLYAAPVGLIGLMYLQ